MQAQVASDTAKFYCEQDLIRQWSTGSSKCDFCGGMTALRHLRSLALTDDKIVLASWGNSTRRYTPDRALREWRGLAIWEPAPRRRVTSPNRRSIMAIASYEVVGSGGVWRVKHDGEPVGSYQTKESAFEAAVAAASLAVREGYEVQLSVPGTRIES